MTTKTRLFVFDWWVIQKRVVYLAVAFLVLCGMAAGVALAVPIAASSDFLYLGSLR